MLESILKDLLEFKNHFGEIKDLDEKTRTVSGYLSSFGNLDNHQDIIVKGAYAKTLLDRKDQIFFLNQHNWEKPHGLFKTLIEDEKGLYFESNPLPNTTFSNDLIELYASGIIKEHSVGFQTIKSDFDNETGIRTIKEVKLYEGSNVTLGANGNTPFMGFKSNNIKEVNDQAKLILKAFRNGRFTDETFGLLELALKQLQSQAYELGIKNKTLKKETKPSEKDTSLQVEPLITTIEKFRLTI